MPNIVQYMPKQKIKNKLPIEEKYSEKLGSQMNL
jgi:hypothetical protein